MAEARTDTCLSDDLITCPICFANFKIPKSLPCLHTFCKECLQTFISKAVEENKPKVECPICRTFVSDFTGQDIDQWIESLPTNFIVNSLIDRYEIQTGKRNCDICVHLSKSEPATKWCQECTEAYCDECSKGHNFHKLFRKHSLITIKDAPDNLYFTPEESIFDCSVHKNRKIELFCFDHTEPCCLTCMTVHHRKCDKVTTLEEAAENFRNDPTFLSFTKRMDELTSEFRKETTSHNETKRNYALQVSQIKHQAQTKKMEMIKHIEMLYKKFEDDASAIEKQHEADDLYEILTQKEIQLELLVKTLKTLKSTSSEMSLFLEFYKMKGKQKDFEEFLEQYKSNKKEESVELIFHESVKEFECVVCSFGEIRIVNKVQAQVSSSETIDYKSSALKEVVTIEEEGVRFSDAVCISNDVIVAVDDKKNAIWAFDITGTLLSKSCLSCRPWALAFIDNYRVVVTLRGKRSLQYFSFNEKSKTLKESKTISLNENPMAIAYADSYLFVTFAGRVKRLNLDGTVTNEVKIPEASNSLFGISYFNGNIMVGDHSDSGFSLHVLQIGKDISVKFQKSYSAIHKPVGVSVDRDGNIYMSGWGSNNVIQISQNGDLNREIIKSLHGIKSPDGINVSDDGRKLILTHGNKITVFEFV